MLPLTIESVANAVRRAFERRCKIRRITDVEFAVRCANLKHTDGHIVRIERRLDGTLEGECVLKETGELCPAAAKGKRICYHITATLPLFLHLEKRRSAEREATRRERLARLECRRSRQFTVEPEGDPDALLNTGPQRRRAERVGTFTI